MVFSFLNKQYLCIVTLTMKIYLQWICQIFVITIINHDGLHYAYSKKFGSQIPGKFLPPAASCAYLIEHASSHNWKPQLQLWDVYGLIDIPEGFITTISNNKYSCFC